MTMKRALEDSDCDDFLDGEDCNGLGSPSQSCQVVNRKKRRGVIEKKRRDRINSSLSELKRLVPTAFEKQGSAKLEKAEILQMTVDHLKMLNARGLNNPATFEVDYRGMGFRECVAETARYLATAEGLDIQNPLRIRLLGHLEAYGAQKEVSLKADLSGYNWHRLSSYASQSALYPTATPDSSSLSSKLKEPSYGTSYPSPTTTASPGYYGQGGGTAPTAAALNNAFNHHPTSTSSLPHHPHPHPHHQHQQHSNNSFSSSTGLTNLSPNALYASGNYNSDLYKSFRPW